MVSFVFWEMPSLSASGIISDSWVASEGDITTDGTGFSDVVKLICGPPLKIQMKEPVRRLGGYSCGVTQQRGSSRCSASTFRGRTPHTSLADRPAAPWSAAGKTAGSSQPSPTLTSRSQTPAPDCPNQGQQTRR